MTTPANSSAGQFGDTTYTKLFVGGLAWQTQKETMKKYFEQFGEILEAVVITDKNTGRSKGYGFVTFKEPEEAKRACVDATPVIDGRRANCNLASLGVHRSRPSTPQIGERRGFRAVNSFHAGFQGGVGTAFPSVPNFPHYATQLGIRYDVYGYSPYSPDYPFPTGYYGVCGGTSSQYPIFNTSATTNYYPYLQFGQGVGCANTHSSGHDYFSFQWPQHYYGAPFTLTQTPSSNTGVGVTMAPALHAPIHHHQTHNNSFLPISSI